MSDQDFFFDEEPAPAAAAKPAKAASKPAAKPVTTARPAAADEAPASFFEQSLSTSVAAVFAVAALLVGFILGFLTSGAMATNQPPASTLGTSTGMPATGGAPGALTPEQIQQGSSGQMPPGHPSISGGASGTPAAPGK